MKFTRVKCGNCAKEIYVLEPYVRDFMYCTIGCMEKMESNGYQHDNLVLYQLSAEKKYN